MRGNFAEVRNIEIMEITNEDNNEESSSSGERLPMKRHRKKLQKSLKNLQVQVCSKTLKIIPVKYWTQVFVNVFLFLSQEQLYDLMLKIHEAILRSSNNISNEDEAAYFSKLAEILTL